MAKELAMVENNEIGRKTRRYFILMESAAVEMATHGIFNPAMENAAPTFDGFPSKPSRTAAKQSPTFG